MGEQETLKDTMSKWTEAVTAHNARKYDVALDKYAEITEISARMFYNMACAYIALQDAEGAIRVRRLTRICLTSCCPQVFII